MCEVLVQFPALKSKMNEELNTHESYQLWIIEGTPFLWILAAISPDSGFCCPSPHFIFMW